MDSAGGTAKDARFKDYQGILSLRGKGLNTERSSREEFLKNQEYQTLISALGTGFDEDYEDSKLRYNKVIIMTDADEDGKHIQNLLMTFFYRHMKGLIENGHLYLARAPLYKVYYDLDPEKRSFAWDAKELEVEVAKMHKRKGKGKVKVQRFKGLGRLLLL